MAVGQSLTDLTDKLPPQNLDAERALLGCMLLANETIDEVADIVLPAHFYLDAHRRIAEAIYGLYENMSGGIDVVTVAEQLEKRDELEEIGGPVYLNEIMETVAHGAHAKHYATIVREKAVLRQLREACRQILRDVHDELGDTNNVLNTAERRIFNILELKGSTENLEIREILMEAFDALHERWSREGQLSGMSTGFADLDNLTAGLHPSDLIVLAARPSMGKTALVCNMAYAIAKNAKRTSDAADEHPPGSIAPGGVLMFSLEQSKLELAERFLCIVGKLDGHRLKQNELGPDEMDQVQRVASQLSELPIFIDDRGGRTMGEIAAIARRTKRRHGIALIVVDYLQLIEPDDRFANREQQVAQTARRLKYLAKEINVPVVALAQLNRAVELRDHKEPRLADLRESGAIEQDADLVMFLHRPEVYWNEKDGDPQKVSPEVLAMRENERGLAQIFVRKHRNGRTGNVNLSWIPESMRFVNRTNRDEPASAHLYHYEYED